MLPDESEASRGPTPTGKKKPWKDEGHSRMEHHIRMAFAHTETSTTSHYLSGGEERIPLS